MNWLKTWIFGNQTPAKQAMPQLPKEDLQARYLRDSLNFAKHHQKTAYPLIQSILSRRHPIQLTKIYKYVICAIH